LPAPLIYDRGLPKRLIGAWVGVSKNIDEDFDYMTDDNDMGFAEAVAEGDAL
jgi:hypothetical protein